MSHKILRRWPWAVGIALALASLVWGLREVEDKPTFLVAWVGLVANCCMAGAGLLAFRLWRMQVRGAAEHDIAMRMLRAAYTVDDAVQDSWPEGGVRDLEHNLRAPLAELHNVALDVRVLWGMDDAHLVYKLLALMTEWDLSLMKSSTGASLAPTTVWPFEWREVVAGEPTHWRRFIATKQQCVADLERWATQHANLDRRSQFQTDAVLVHALRSPRGRMRSAQAAVVTGGGASTSPAP